MSSETSAFESCMDRLRAKEVSGVWEFERSGYVFKAKNSLSGDERMFWLCVCPKSSNSYPREFVPLSEHATQGPLEFDVMPSIVFSKESTWTRFGKSVGLDRELQVGDERFDDEVYIETNVPSKTIHPMCMSTGFRQSILSLFDKGFRTVHVFDEVGPVRVECVRPDAGLFTEEGFGALLDDVVAIAQALPPLRVQNPDRSSLRVRQLVTRYGQWSLFLGVVCMGGAYYLWSPLGSMFIGRPFAVGGTLWGVGFVALLVYLSKFSGGFRVVMTYTLSGLPGTVLLYAGLCLTLNGALDTKGPEVIPTELTKMYITQDDSKSYMVDFDVEYEGMSYSYSVSVGEESYRNFAIHRRKVNVFVRKGFLGVPWFGGVEPRIR